MYICVLQVWDTAGQERFRSMTSAFYNKAQGVILAFDVGKAHSFQSIPSWIRDIRRVRILIRLFYHPHYSNRYCTVSYLMHIRMHPPIVK
jgi:hypothetical protein